MLICSCVPLGQPSSKVSGKVPPCACSCHRVTTYVMRSASLVSAVDQSFYAVRVAVKGQESTVG
eukprot:1157944-Pelagomonas_calceolata.AAC.2